MVETNQLKVKWFSHWHPMLDEALDVLPPMDEYPHELYRLLLNSPASAQKRIALISNNKIPIAVAGLRNNDHHWEPTTQWILPGVIFPHYPGTLSRALEALNQDITVGWWRWETEPPDSPLIRHKECQVVYQFNLTENFEDYWRKNGQFKTVRLRRNRCKNFKIMINQPGALEWTIRNWEAKWRAGSHEMPDLQDRLAAGAYLQDRGRCFVFSMLDQDTIIAGCCVMIHHKDVVALVNYRNPRYDWYGTLDRLIDYTFEWSQESGYRMLDIGGDHDYKIKWAPPGGKKWIFNICPAHIYYPKLAVRRVKYLISSLRPQKRVAETHA